MVRVGPEPVDPSELLRTFSAGRARTGAVVSFTGLVRALSDGAAVSGLELQHYPGFTEAEIERCLTEARSRFAVHDLLVVHRIGRIAVGEAIVFVAAAAGHRRPAFEAADFLMDYLKTEAAFWKKEHSPKGQRWIEPRSGDYADADRWRTEPAVELTPASGKVHGQSPSEPA